MIQYESIEFVLRRVPSADGAAAPFERLGLHLTPPTRLAGQEGAFRLLPVGGPDNLFAIELSESGTAPDEGFALVALRVRNLAAAVQELEGRGVRIRRQSFAGAAGASWADSELAVLDAAEQAGAPLALIEFKRPAAERFEAIRAAAGPSQGVALKRFDHIAAFTPNLAATTRFWTDVLGIAKSGEVSSPAMIINQMKVGDGVFELIGPASQDPNAPPRRGGLSNNVAFEVPDIEAAVAHARAAGFTPPEPRPGPLPGTRVSTVAAAELGGIALQMLQYI